MKKTVCQHNTSTLDGEFDKIVASVMSGFDVAIVDSKPDGTKLLVPICWSKAIDITFFIVCLYPIPCALPFYN